MSSCADKVPFTIEKPISNEGLVYIYVSQEVTDAPEVDRVEKYKIKIGKKSIEGYISDGEYKVFHIKPSNTVIEVTRDAILSHKLTLHVKENESYYLKIAKNSLSSFSFQLINDKEKALQELHKMVLAGSVLEKDDSENTLIITKDKYKKIQRDIKSNKIEQIKSAYKLKEDGIIDEKEFQKLKQEILDK